MRSIVTSLKLEPYAEGKEKEIADDKVLTSEKNIKKTRKYYILQPTSIDDLKASKLLYLNIKESQKEKENMTNLSTYVPVFGVLIPLEIVDNLKVL